MSRRHPLGVAVLVLRLLGGSLFVVNCVTEFCCPIALACRPGGRQEPRPPNGRTISQDPERLRILGQPIIVYRAAYRLAGF